MTIRSDRDHGQRCRPRMSCLKKVEATVVQMQDPSTGVKGTNQKLNITTIPHAITGQDIVAWITKNMNMDNDEAQAFSTMLVAFGYIYPLQDHKKLVLRPDGSLYRFQVNKWKAEDTDYAIYLAKRNIRKKGVLDAYEQEEYNKLHKWMNHKWDFIVMQAKEQYHAGKARQKADRVVFDCQERAYWIVHRPPPQTHSAMDYGLDRHIDPNVEEKKTYDYYKRIVIYMCFMGFCSKSLFLACSLVKYMMTFKNHDPFLVPCLPRNPWQTDHDSYWELNTPDVEVPTKMRVERWSFSFYELLSDPRGRADFKVFLKKEFSGENLAFWEAAEELKWGTAASMSEKAEHIFKTFLAPGAPRWINIDGRTMGLTVKGLEHPHRYVFDAAQTHIFMLMKKDTFYRYLKSPVYKEIQKKAISPAPQFFCICIEAQLQQNMRNRRPSVSPIITWQKEQEEKAKAAAAAGPIDIKKLMASKLDRK
uniref:Regulator of G protein signaling 9a n=2 Tax=Cyprinus carpio TaxID=7962 RepID=A0A9R1SDD9_CYPCA